MISFMGGTTINSMLKMTQMSMKWEERKNNIGKEVNENKSTMQAEPPEIKRMKEIVENNKKASYISGIQIKLKSGGTLTDEELNYLKANNPQMYKDAVEIAAERERYKRELENCRTKEEADRLNFNKIGSFLSQARVMSASNNGKACSVQAMDKIMAKIMGIKVDFEKYVKSGAYDSLPSEEDENNKKKVKRKAPADIKYASNAAFAAAIIEIKAEIARLENTGSVQSSQDYFPDNQPAKSDMQAPQMQAPAAPEKAANIKTDAVTTKFTAKV